MGTPFFDTLKPRLDDVFYYDGDCGFCQWSAEQLRRLAAPGSGALTQVTFGGMPGGSGASGGLGARSSAQPTPRPLAIEPAWPDKAPADVAPLIDRYAVFRAATGDVFRGHRAIGAALKNHASSRLWRMAGSILLVRVASPVFAVVYMLVALNRRRLAPLVGADECQVR